MLLWRVFFMSLFSKECGINVAGFLFFGGGYSQTCSNVKMSTKSNELTSSLYKGIDCCRSKLCET